jgi:serine/threonine protein kinase
VFAALCHCHSRGLDVKSLTLQHILFTEQSPTTVKLLVPFNAELEHNSPYMAPELVMDSYVHQANCLWSCRVILSALLVGELGIETRKNLGYEKFKFAYTKWQAVSKHAKALVVALLSRDYRRRPSIEKCMQDPWIAATQTKLTLTPSLRTALRSMARLRPTASLKKTLLQLMLNFVLPSEDLKEAKQAFRELDTDMDGTTSAILPLVSRGTGRGSSHCSHQHGCVFY